MKAYVSTVSVVILIVVFGCSAKTPSNEECTERLMEGTDRIETLETVLKAPEEYSAVALCLCAVTAFDEERLEDSAFLFYAGQLRARFDQKCFPPVQSGGDSPMLAWAVLSMQAGSSINPAIMAEPAAFARVIERLGKWHPKASADYNPGYEFIERKSEEEARAAAEPNRIKFLSRMQDLSSLLNDPEYYAAFRVVQAYNLGIDPKERPTEEEKEKASETMKRIEKEKGLKGICAAE